MYETAISKALDFAEAHLRHAASYNRFNISACVEYLNAVVESIHGLEGEADELLIESKMVARFYWDRSPQLYERIEQYLNRDRLRPILSDSIKGIIACHRYAQSNAKGFFLNNTTKLSATNELMNLLHRLHGYLNDLDHSMGYDIQDFSGPSGINLKELLQIQNLIEDGNEAGSEEERRMEIIRIAEATQQRRERDGMLITADAKRIAQELVVAFRLTKEDFQEKSGKE